MPVPTLVSDFTGSDESPLSEGGNWAILNSSGNALQRISNSVASVIAANGESYWTPGNFGPDMEAYCTIGVTANTIQLFVRLQGEGGAATFDGYSVSASTSTTTINRFTNASSLGLLAVTVSVSWAAGDKLGVRCVGSTIEAWRLPSGSTDWVRLASVQDTTYLSAGKIGLRVPNTTGRIDDLYAGTNTDMFGPNAPVYYIKG